MCALGALAALGAAPAVAAPTLAIGSPTNGSFTSTTPASVSGTSTDTTDPVAVAIYKGAPAEGSAIQGPTSVTPAVEGGGWSVAVTPLPAGPYTAVAEQTELGQLAKSTVAFTVKTAPPAVTLSPVASPTSSPTPALEGEAGTAPGDEPAVTVTIYEGNAVGGGVASSGPATVSAGSWTYVPGKKLPDGTYTAQATQRDAAENTGKSEPRTFTVKAAVPAVTLLPISSPSNNAEPTLEGAPGTAAGDEPAVTVKIYEGGSVGPKVAASGSATVNGTKWTYNSPHLPDGTYTAQASQRDTAGNTGKSTPQTFTIDTVKPVVTVDVVPSPTSNSMPTLKGTAGTANGDLQAVTVTIYESPTAGGPVASSGPATVSGGSWSYKPEKKLSDSTYTAQATQRDAAGNEGESAPRTFTVKAALPAVTLYSVPSPSNNATPVLEGGVGTAAGDEPAVTVKIYEGESVGSGVVASGSATVNGTKWTYNSPHLPDGTYTAQASQRDTANNVGTSTPQTFTIETAPPKVSLSAVPSPINDPTPTLEGVRGTKAHDDPTVSVTVYEGSSAAGKVVASSTFGVSGAAFSYTAPHLADGTYTAQAEQKDSLGNLGKSAERTFTIDTVVPPVTLNSVPSPSNNPAPKLSGGAGSDSGDAATISVTIYEGSSPGGGVATSGSAPRTGESWSYTPSHLPDGTYTAQATQSDSAKNVGTSAPQTFTINTASPTVTLASPAPLSNNATPSFNGSASDTTPVTVTLYEGAKPTGTPVWKVTTAVSAGSWSSEPVSPPLKDGQYTAIATQPSSLGNPEGKSTPTTFKVNTAAPTVALAQPPSPSNNLSPSFTGTASDITPVTIKVYVGERPTGSVVSEATATSAGEAWTSGPAKPALAAEKRTYTAIASQKSSIPGNPEGTSVPVIFTVDTSAPIVTLTPPLKLHSNNATPTFTGTASDTTGVTVSIYKGKVVKGAVVTTATAVPAAGAWTSGPTVAALKDGEYTAQATQLSSIGNPAGVSGPVTFNIDTKPPAVTLTPLPLQINTAKPVLSGRVGTEAGDLPKILVKVYKGTEAVGVPALEGEGTISPGSKGKPSTWSFESTSLADGPYTAQVTQEDEAGNIGVSPSVPFEIDTEKPAVTLNSLSSPSNNPSPSFSGTSSDKTSVTVAVYSGPNAIGTPVATVVAAGPSVPGGEWKTAALAAVLPNHAYTAVATQTDEAGNKGESSSVHFVVDTLAPTVTLDQPRSPSNNRTPVFTGFGEDHKPVLIRIYAANGSIAATTEAPGTGGRWTSPQVSPALSDGTYTVTARQESSAGNHPGETAPVTFTIDTEVPRVKLSEPASGASKSGESQVVGGSTEGDADDGSSVTVQVFSGAAISQGQAPVQSVEVNSVSGSWSATFTRLAAGIYAVRAQQSDNAGNVGASATNTFTLNPPVAASAAAGHPVASFSWYPLAPHAGERVSLVSGSTDATSRLAVFAWDLAGTGAFQAAGQVVSTSFATAGNHVVRLRVTDATGAESVASETIPVGSPQAALMQPFPLVRIVTTRTASGLKLRLLSVLAVPGARITITCKGHGCPVRRQSKVAAAGKVGLASISFGRFQRVLNPGTILEIRVSKLGEIGKYTSINIRRGGVLKRLDTCLDPNGIKPMPCPS